MAGIKEVDLDLELPKYAILFQLQMDALIKIASSIILQARNTELLEVKPLNLILKISLRLQILTNHQPSWLRDFIIINRNLRHQPILIGAVSQDNQVFRNTLIQRQW